MSAESSLFNLNKHTEMNTPVMDEIKSRVPEPSAIEQALAFASSAESILRQIIDALPVNREWLDDGLEFQAKCILKLI